MNKWLQGFLGRKPDSLIALEIAPTGARALRARRDGTSLFLDGFRVAAVNESHSLEDACRDVLSLRITDEPVAIAVWSPDAAIRQIELPPMSEQEMREALPWEARRHVTGLGDDAVIDAQILGATESGATNALLAAFPRNLYEDLASLWSTLRVEPAFVDLAPLAVMNAVMPVSDAGPQAILDLGARAGSFSIFSSKGVVLYRDLAPRVDRIDSVLGTAFGVHDGALDALKRSGKLPNGAPPRATLDKAMAEVVTDLGEDIRSGMLYLENRTGGAIDHVLLAGSTASFLDRIGIADAIATAAGTSFVRLNPFQRFRAVGVDQVGLERSTFELAAAAGVAARFLTSSS